MGWLRTLSEQSGVGSLEQLAKLLQESGELVGARGKAVQNVRSGANLLRDVDAGKRALSDELAGALAGALDVSIVDLRHAIEDDTVAGPPDPSRLRVPGTGVFIDPARDPLPPGYPSVVLDAGRWNRHWWHAANLLAPELRFVAQCVSARHRGVQVVEAANLGESLAQLPERGAAMILVEGVTGEERRLVGDLPRHLAVLVVASKPYATRRSRQDVDEAEGDEIDTDGTEDDLAGVHGREKEDKWQTVDTEVPNVIGLVEWFASRVEPGGGFEAKAARHLLGQPRFERACGSPGRVLEMCQVIDEVDAKKLATRHGVNLLRTILKARKEEASVRVLGKEPWKVIVDLLKALATRPRGLRAPIEPELLESLIARPDMSHLRALATDDALSDAEARAMLRGALEPSVKRLGAALAQLGWLAPVGERWHLSEHWLVTELIEEIIDGWIDEAGESLGLAMLGHDVAPLVIGRLYERFLTGDLRALEAAVRDIEIERPSAVARVEGCLRAAGLASIGLRDDERVEAIREAFHTYGRAVRGIAMPLIDWSENDRGWIAKPLFAAAFLCTSVPEHSRMDLPGHYVRVVVRRFDKALFSLGDLPRVASALFDFADRHLRGPAGGVFGRALEGEGSASNETPRQQEIRAQLRGLGVAASPLRFVWSLLDATGSGIQSPVGVYDLLSAAKQFPPLLEVLQAKAAERGLSMDAVWDCIWAAPGDAKAVSIAQMNAWSKAPVSLWTEVVRTAPANRLEEICFWILWRRPGLSALPDRYWPALFVSKARSGFSRYDVAREAWLLASLPVHCIAAVVSSGAFAYMPPPKESTTDREESARLRARFARRWWKRFRDETSPVLNALDDPSVAESLVDNAPFDARGELLPRMVALSTGDTQARVAASRWVARWIRERVDGWEDAWRSLRRKGPVKSPSDESEPTEATTRA